MRNFTEEDRRKALEARMFNKKQKQEAKVETPPTGTSSIANPASVLQSQIQLLEQARERRMLKALQENELLAIQIENQRMSEQLTGNKQQVKPMEFEMFDKFTKFYETMNERFKQEPAAESPFEEQLVMQLLPHLPEILKNKNNNPNPTQQNNPVVVHEDKPKTMIDKKRRKQLEMFQTAIRNGMITLEQAYAEFCKQCPAQSKLMTGEQFTERFNAIKSGNADLITEFENA